MAEEYSADEARAAVQEAHARRKATRTPDANLLASDDEQRHTEELLNRTFRKIRVLAEEGSYETSIVVDTDADADDAPIPKWAEQCVQAITKRLQSLGYKVWLKNDPRHPYGSFERYHRREICIDWKDF